MNVRVVYYTHPAFFEPALCLVRELSRRADVDLLLELAPEAWQTAGFDVRHRELPAGIVPGDDVLKDAFPEGIRRYWQSAASFNLVVHRSRRSLHPDSWRISCRVLKFTANRGADILHVDDVDVSPRLALALPTFSRVPVMITVHDPEPHTGERNWRKWLARRLAFSRARRFLLYNAALRDDFCRRYRIAPSAVEVGRLGIYDIVREWDSSSSNDTGSTVVFFGRLSPYKGLDVFYEAVPMIADRVAGLRFVVAGRPVPGYTPPAPPTFDGSATLVVVDRYLSNAEVARLLRRASVVVCPYRDATQSGVILSAFAFGTPVVATAVGGLPEYVIPGRTGLLVPVGDPVSVANAVCRILEDAALAAQLRRGIASAAQNELSWVPMADALLRAYERLARPC